MKHATPLILSLTLFTGIAPAAHAAPATQPVVNPAPTTPDETDSISQMMPTPPANSPSPDRHNDGPHNDGPHNDGPSSDNPPDDNRPRRNDRPRPRFLQPYSTRETEDAMQFMQMHSPERYKFVSNLPEGEKKTGIKNFATRAYQSWMRLSHDDWKLYAVVMKRVAVEDEIFGLVAQLHDAQAHNDPPEKQQTLNNQLHDKVVSLVDIGIKERQIRLDNLSRTIKDEQQKLNADSADTKSLVEKRLQTILADDKLRALRAGDSEDSKNP